jgi:Leucine Rich repeat
LGGNNIQDEGAIAIAEDLKENTTLTLFNLDCNNIPVEAAVAITNTLT